MAIAHDSTCKPGEEWIFHGFADPYDVHGSLESPIDARDKELLDKDMDDLRKHYAKEDATDDVELTKGGCIMAIGFVVFLVGVAIWALT
jgi:hypothetical protein